MSKQQNKLFVKKKINGAALNHVKLIQEQHLKVRAIKFSKGGATLPPSWTSKTNPWALTLIFK